MNKLFTYIYYIMFYNKIVLKNKIIFVTSRVLQPTNEMCVLWWQIYCILMVLYCCTVYIPIHSLFKRFCSKTIDFYRNNIAFIQKLLCEATILRVSSF